VNLRKENSKVTIIFANYWVGKGNGDFFGRVLADMEHIKQNIVKPPETQSVINPNY
jgi:hypothetical protein